MRTYNDSDTVSGATLSKSFCGVCGSILFAENDRHEDVVFVASGSVDAGLDDEDLKPKVEYFCKDRRAWMDGREGVDCRETV